MSDTVTMTKVVISERFGGFGLSAAAASRLRELGAEVTNYGSYDGPRDDPRLVQVVEELGAREASGAFAALVVVEVPDDAEWYIHEYDGYESVYEKHRVWTSSGEE